MRRQHVPIKDHWAEQRIFVRRAVLAGVLALIGIGILISRLIVLQVVNYEHFQSLSKGNRVRIEPLAPTRGLIYDRNGVLLAENIPAYQLEITPEAIDDLDLTLERLGKFIELRKQDLDRFRKHLRSSRRFNATPLKFRLTDQEVARFAVQRQDFPGVDIRARLARHYPGSGNAAHAIGYVSSLSEADLQRLDRAAYAGTTHTGKTGVERAYEHLLHGEAGYRQVLVNAQGRALNVLFEEPPTPGNDLYLSLDSRMQLAAEQALIGKRGAVVAIDPRDGAVLTFVSMPTYDPNPFGEGLSQKALAKLFSDPDIPMFNRALKGSYPPGSTVKPMLALAGLQHQVITGNTSTFCPGYFSLPGDNHRYRDWRAGGHGTPNMHDAIAQSCDVYFYELALELGIDTMHAFMSEFGFGQLSGIDIGGEKPGLMPSRQWKQQRFSNPAERAWFPGETVITGIGQGFTLATPLQLAQATAVLAARGQRFKPRLVAAVRDASTDTTSPREPAPLPPVLVEHPHYWDEVIRATHAVVTGPRGTARAIGDAPYPIAGKSGTAQVFTVGQDEEYDADELEERLRDHAWFIAFAPIQAPEVALAVMVENGGSGSGVAAPVARRVLDAYFLPEAPQLGQRGTGQ